MIVEYIKLPFNKSYPKSVIGLGYFDGVHLGHKDLIDNVINIAKSKNIKSSIFTFNMPIRKLFNKDFYGELTPLKYKLDIFKKLGLDICYVLEFDKDVASIDKDRFISDILDKLYIDTIVVGSDYRFGKLAKGTIDDLTKFYDVKVIDFINSNGSKVSSSTIINYINNGNIELSNRLLGRNYFIEGKVIHGLGNGKRKLVPTANIDYQGFVLPKQGVYKVNVIIDDNKYNGVANIGIHPTIDKLDNPTLEVYIDKFNEDIYDKFIRIEFIKYIRDENKFNNINDLLDQIKKDINV